jgi:glycerol uptake facilitator protein
LEADRATKLSAFWNRPAINMPIFNFICEVFCTYMLLIGLFLIDDRFEINPDPQATLFYSKGLKNVMTSLYIMMCILCLGGPTGFSSNPCRDLGPRLAHWVLPINGKGSSEFKFSLIINVAAFVGAALAAGSFLLLSYSIDNKSFIFLTVPLSRSSKGRAEPNPLI